MRAMGNMGGRRDTAPARANGTIGRRRGSLYESRLLCCLLLLVLVKPAYFGQFDAINRIYVYGSFLIALVLFVLVIVENWIDFPIVWIVLFYGVGLVATALGSGEVYKYCRSEFCSLAMCLMTVLWLDKSPGTFLRSSQILQVLVYVNLLTVLLYPDGLYEDMYTANWFLGYKNPQIRTILPIVALSMMYSYWRHGRLTLQAYALIACSCATFLLIGSATALVGMAIFLLLVFLFHSKAKRIPRLINLTTCFLLVLLVDVGIYVFSMQEAFSFIIEDVLQRSLNFTGRITIWGIALDMIAEKPLLGYGYLTSDAYASIFGFAQATHPHSYVLYVLCTGGALLLLVVFAGVVFASRRLSASMDSVYPKILLALLVSFFVMGIDEALVSTVLLYPSLLMAMKVDRLATMGYCEGVEGPAHEGRAPLGRLRLGRGLHSGRPSAGARMQ